ASSCRTTTKSSCAPPAASRATPPSALGSAPAQCCPQRPELHRQDLAGIHNAVWIQCPLDAVHQRKLDRVLVARQQIALELPDTMLGTDGAAELVHAVVY